MKKLLFIVIAILVVVFIFAMMKDTLIQIVVEKGVKAATGLKLHMAGIEVGIRKPIVDIRELKLFNPHGFKDRIMLNMPEIFVDYNLGDILKGNIHLNEVRIDLKEFVVVKNTKGELNLNYLTPVKEQEEVPGKPAEEKPKKEMKLQIDSLSLKVGKVVYKDYSQGGQPQVQEYDVNIDQTYKNITDLKSLVSLIVVKSLAQTTISKLANFEMGKLQDQLKGVISDKLFGAGAAGSKVEQAIEGVASKLFKE